MGWLFGKKKIPPPNPAGGTFDEKKLRFTRRFPEERMIEPEQYKAAAGLDASLDFSLPLPEEPTEAKAPAPSRAWPKNPFPFSSNAPAPETQREEPFFLKIDAYRQMLAETGELKHLLGELQECSLKLEHSEYNEEANIEKLKKSIRLAHDRLLQADKILFKA